MPRPPLPADYSLAAPAPRAGDAASRLAFGFDAAGVRPQSVAGDAGTFARASFGTTVDSTGAIRTVAPNQPRWIALDLDGDGVRESLGLLLERASRNLMLDPERLDLWALANCTVTPNWLSVGEVSLCRLLVPTSANGQAQQDILRADDTVNPPFTTNAVKGVSFVIAPSQLTFSFVPTRVSVQDIVSMSVVLDAAYTFDAAGVPQVAVTAGTYLGMAPLAGGAWRIYCQTSTVNALHRHQVFVQPNSGLSAVVDCVIGAFQVEDGPYPTSYIPNPVGVTAARSGETLSFPLAFAPQDVTLFVEMARPLWLGAGGAAGGGRLHRPLDLGQYTGGGTAGSAVLSDLATGTLGASRFDGAQSTSGVAPTPAAARGALRERLVWTGQFGGWATRALPPSVLCQSDAGVQASPALEATGTAPAATWDQFAVTLSRAGVEPDAVLLAAKVAPGLRTLDEMRGLR